MTKIVLTISAKISKEDKQKLGRLKEVLGIETNSELIRFLIREKYNLIENTLKKNVIDTNIE